MRTQVEARLAGAHPAQSLHLPVQAAPAATSTPPVLSSDLQGTVDAVVQAVESCSYDMRSNDWVRGEPIEPVGSLDQFSESFRARLRAKDLIAELDAINAQIHRMMFQVERAVSRLATSGGIS
ncbi:MAG TPA: hypothetical protein VFR92_02095 [Sphingomicrobium sp.]|jgi:hypothetical protein|nr:hypothetical protein [Sphingomicrobium sp.]